MKSTFLLLVQPYKQNYSEAKTLRDQVNQRIRKVKTGEINVSGWMRKEKIEWLRSGNQPERLQNEVLTLFSTIEKYLLDLIEGNAANSTVVSYKDHLKRANHYFKDIPLNHVTNAMVQQYVYWLNKQTIVTGQNRGKLLSTSSQKKHIEDLRRVFRWAKRTADQNINCEIFGSLTYPKKS